MPPTIEFSQLALRTWALTEVDNEIKECLICNKPLGQESRDLRFPVCHDHRMCPKCGFAIESSAEITYCWKNNQFPALHARCLAVETKLDPTNINDNLDLTAEMLNLARLIITPNPELSRDGRSSETQAGCAPLINLRTHDQLLLIAEQARVVAAYVSLAASRKKHQEDLESEETSTDPRVIRNREAKEKRQEAMREVERERAKPKTKVEAKRQTNDEKTIANFLMMAEMISKNPTSELYGKPQSEWTKWAMDQMTVLKNSRKDMLS